MTPLISVIIPTLNRVNLLKEAVESVLAQTRRDWELTVIDDGSTDNTERLMREFCQKDPRIHYIKQERSGGVSRARNRAISHAHGKYLAFLDDDDLFMPDKLDSQLQYLENHPEISFVYAQADIVDAQGNHMWIDPKKPVTNYVELFENSGIRIQTVMCRKELFEQAGGFDESLSFGEDYDLWLRMAQIAPFHFMSRIVVKFRIHGTNACNDHLNLFLQRETILERIPLSEDKGLTRKIKDLRLGLNEYRLAKLFYEQRKYSDAFKYFLKAVCRKKDIANDWALQDEKKCVTPITILKPYGAMLFCLIKAAAGK